VVIKCGGALVETSRMPLSACNERDPRLDRKQFSEIRRKPHERPLLHPRSSPFRCLPRAPLASRPAATAKSGVVRYRERVCASSSCVVERPSASCTPTPIPGRLTLSEKHKLALLRGHGGEGSPLLLHPRAAAFRALDLFLVVLGKGQNQRELFLAGSAKVFVMGHGFLPSGDDPQC